ncbi:MAG: sugar phosphate isomerase/epimerase [Clostridia bacterium]|nr:sugar phosphate isomerase/epimerase [Clostridia bacterium]
MKIATTTGDFDRYLSTYQEKIDCVIEAGFKYIDLSLYTIYKDDELLLSSDWQENAKRILENTMKKGATFVQAHSPGGNPITGDENAEILLEATIRAIDICGAMGIPNIVVHGGSLKGMNKEQFFEKNKVFFEKLFPAMERNNVNVLCENSTQKNMRDMYFTNSGKDMKEFVEYVNHPLFHACWDTGHANCEGNQYEDILSVGEDLYAVHINDNSGRGDEHVLPYFGTVNMDEVMHALIDVNYKGVFTFECGSTLRPALYWQGNRKEFAKDTRLSNPPLFMQKQIEKLMYDMGEYILKSYGCFSE